MSKQKNEMKPWWREPWPWILMAGPAIAVVGCAITIYLALDGFGSEPVHDGGVKKGLVVTKTQETQGASISGATSVE